MAGKEIVSSACQLKTGDHVSFPVKFLFGTYQHHAIVLAVKRCNTIKIIHVAQKAKGLRGYEVREQEICVDERIKRRELVRYKYAPEECSDPYEAVCKAKCQIGDFKYGVISNNSGHFARWCNEKNHRC